MTDHLDTAAAAPYRWRWPALAALLTAEAMNLLDATVVPVVVPDVRADLAAGDGQTQWLTAGYTLPFALLLITGGRLGDLLGRRPAFVAGMAVFVLCSALCALAPSVPVLLAARILQGAAAALVIPQTIGLIRAMFHGPERATAFGMIGPVMALAAVCGPVLGGVLTEADILGTGWRAVFLVNVPLGVVVLLAAPLIRDDRSTGPRRLDLVGTLLAAVGTGLLVHPLVQGNDAGWPAWTWPTVLLGVVVLAGFVRHQFATARRSASPLVDPGLFRDRVFGAALFASLLFFAVMHGLMFVLVLFLHSGPGYGTLGVGLAMLPWSVGLAIGSLSAGTVLVPRFGARVMRAGVLVLMVGLAATVLLVGTPGPGLAWRLLVPLFVAGTGLGMFTPPFFTSALSRVDDRQTGSASGLLNAVQQLGATVGVAMLGAAFFHLSRDPAIPAAPTAGARLALGVAILMLAAVLALTYPMIRRPVRERP